MRENLREACELLTRAATLLAEARLQCNNDPQLALAWQRTSQALDNASFVYGVTAEPTNLFNSLED